jgi:hypothetical protein
VLDPDDILELPEGVRHVRGALVDDVCGITSPTNAAADEILARAPIRLAAAAELLARRWRVPDEIAIDDALRFAWALNQAGLANVQRSGGRTARLTAWLTSALRLLPLGRLPAAPIRRLPLDTSTRRRAVRCTARALLPRSGVLACAGAVVLLVAGASLGAAAIGLALATGAAFGGALILHEAGHAVALAPVPAAVVLRRTRTSIVHGPLATRRAARVAAAGPLAAGALGVAVATWALHDASFAALLAACPATGHLLGLTVATHDGRVACGACHA